jgi:SAM-dependent methyltransferase
MKDNFSIQSDKYAKFRPGYPDEFFTYLNDLVPHKRIAWDCGTGNGQVAVELAKTFDRVLATDISASQIANACKSKNIIYSIQPAENTDFSAHQFDLVTVAQAIHWFDIENFYKEVRRTVKQQGVVCVMGYGRIQVSKQIDNIVTDFYQNVIGTYWDMERRYIDENYESVPFPFQQIPAPAFEIRLQWSFDHLIGYLNTWSAVKHFIGKNGYNPINTLEAQIRELWGYVTIREVKFPMLLRIGHV